MYASYFGLRCLPFEDRADTQFFYATSDFEEAMASLLYETHAGSGLALILGEAGTGKTVLIRVLLGRLSSTDQAIVLTWPADGGGDLIRECCKGFGVSLSSSQNHSRRLHRLRRHLARVTAGGGCPILIIDQAENLCPGHLAQLATMLDLENEKGRLLRVILAAHPRVRGALDRPELARIRQQLFGERMLAPLAAEETRAYIVHRLRAAGMSDSETFEVDAIERVYELSDGIPRLINRICNASLLAAYGAGAARVNRELVDEISGQPSSYTRSLSAQELALSGAQALTAPWTTAMPAQQHSDCGQEEIAGPQPRSAGYLMPSAAQAPAPYEDSTELSGGSRLERVVAKAERMAATTEASLAQLTAVERHLATLLDRADAVSKSFGPTIQHGIDAVERTERRFASILQQAQQGAADVESRWSQAAELITRLEDLLARADRTGEAAAQVESRLAVSAEQFANQADRVQADVMRLMEGFQNTQRSQAAMERLPEQAAGIIREAEQRTQQLHAIAREQVEILRRVAADETGGVRSAIQDLGRAAQHDIESAMESACGKVDAATRKIAASTSDAEGRAAGASEVVSQAVRQAEQSAQRIGDETVRRSRGAIERDAESAIHNINSAVQRSAEELRVSHQALLDSGAARVRAAIQTDFAVIEQSAQETVDSTQRKLEALSGHCTRSIEEASGVAESVITRLAAAVQEGRGWETELTRTLLPRAREQWRQLTVSASGQLEAAVAHMDQLQARREAVEASVLALSGQAGEIEAKLERCGGVMSRYLVDMEAAAAKAAATRSAIEGLVAHADEKIARMASHHAAASGAAERLSSENVAANRLVENIHVRSEELQRAAGDAESRMAAILARASQIIEQAAAQSRDLQAEHQKSAERLVKLARLVDSAGHVTAELSERTDSAGQTAALLASRQSDAADLLGRAERIGEQAQIADGVFEKLIGVAQRAEGVERRLSSNLERGDAQCTTLDGGIASAREVGEELRQVQGPAMAAAQRLAEQLAAHSLCVQDLESSAQQVTTGMESIRTELADLAEKTAALGEKVHAALEQPHASLDQVQAQAQQLERVCGAVRKVFAALSQATLVARRQAEELRVTGDGAEERCTRLTDETTKAATVLREWVEETVRVQARLERTLSQCPSVQATHPLETVHGINRLFHGFPGSDRSHEADIDAHADQADEAKAGALTRPSARADEIARLIAEASTHEAADVAG